ncbi:seipin-like isoform X2 [Sardina pilchardus]|uniref:seipin-like isoform X2 n=1 Tax=Sardina pilchardus TaxID=27697 RepID=UPI002E1461A3
MEFEGPDVEEQPGEVELLGQVVEVLQSLLEASRLLFQRAQQRALQLAVVLCLLLLLLWTAMFIYGSFYYSYMPTASYSTPVHFYYGPNCQSSAVCSFPMANVSLLRKNKDQVMTYGQPYRISLELEMPESPANQNLGMFMVKMTSYGREGKNINTAARSVMLHYRSVLLQMMSTVLLSPLLLSGASEQKQLVTVELFTDYTENSYLPTAGAVIELQTPRVQVYAAHLYIHAHFSGIRYVLFNFPTLSALIGVSSTFGFLSVIILFSSLQYSFNAQVSRSRVRQRSRQQNSREETPERAYYSEPSDITADLRSDMSERLAAEFMARYKIFTDEPSCTDSPPLLEYSDPPVEACDGMEESIPEREGVSEPEPEVQEQEVGGQGLCAEAAEEKQKASINKAELEESSSIPEALDPPEEEEQANHCVIS